MGGENRGLDLFGEPLVPAREGPGRPEVVWSKEVSDRVLLAFVLGKTVTFAASLAGLSLPTFRKVYFSEIAKRRKAADKHEFRQLALLAEQADKGNVGASKELHRRIEAMRLRDQHHKAAPRPSSPEPKLGKKAALEQAARQQDSLYTPPSAPVIN